MPFVKISLYLKKKNQPQYDEFVSLKKNLVGID